MDNSLEIKSMDVVASVPLVGQDNFALKKLNVKNVKMVDF
tara:strand:+ start:413 stop:532 length:120 start_codon:yes stop_codon:yes gene_type:complete